MIFKVGDKVRFVRFYSHGKPITKSEVPELYHRLGELAIVTRIRDKEVYGLENIQLTFIKDDPVKLNCWDCDEREIEPYITMKNIVENEE